MHEQIGVVDSDINESRAVCATLERHDFRATPLSSLPEFIAGIREHGFQVLILDLDRLSVDNRFLRDLRRQNPQVHVIALSSRTFHPELQEAMRSDISACLGKPVDEDELVYWLKSIGES
jgi:DNA-binding NtrC family response regulator